MKAIILPAVAAAVMVLLATPGQAITCGDVESQLAPCLTYLIGSGDLEATCCDGVKNLLAMTTSSVDKQALCNCVKDAASRHVEIREDLASQLAAKCGVELGVPISRSTDCAL